MRLVLIFFLTLVLGVFIGIGIEPNIRSALKHSHTWKKATISSAPALTPTVKLPLPSPEDQDIANLLHEPDAFHRISGLVDYVNSVPLASISAEMDRVAKMSGQGHDTALELLAARWVDEDPDGARKSMLSLHDAYARRLLVIGVFGSLAKNDPAAAIKEGRELPSEELRTFAVFGVVQQVAQTDPAQAVALLQGFELRKNWMTRSLFNDWADRDPNQASQAALGLPLATERSDALSGITLSLVKRDPQSALTWVEQLPRGEVQDRARSDALIAISYDTPKVSADYLSGLHTLPDSMRTATIAVADNYAEQDPVAAAGWASALAPGNARLTALEMALSDWMLSDPTSALHYYNSLGASVGRDRPDPDALVSQWAKTDPNAALQWVYGMPEGNTKDNAMESAVSEWAKFDPAKAAGYVQAMSAGNLQAKLMAEVSAAWSAEDPRAVSQWMTNLPATKLTPQMYGDLAENWAKNDPAGASAWLQNLAKGLNRDTASSAFSTQIVNSDPPAALMCAESIDNPKLQQASVLAVLQKWQASNPQDAAAAAAQAPLSPEQKSKFALPPSQ